jgi:radical SAM superfamily enzyme YgiQ (UPF0313 family)
LANCASIARRAGCEVEIIDGQALGLPPEELARKTERADLVVLTSTGLDRWQCPYNDAAPFVEAARALKKAGRKLFVTGFHGTVSPTGVLTATGADAVIRGEPEGAVAEIAAGRDPSEIAGLSYMRLGGMCHNGERAAYDLTKLPLPAFELFDLSRYIYEILGGNLLLFEATRGCPYNCTFCSKVMYGKGLRRKTADQVIAEIDYALERTPVRTAYFMDLEFTVARELVEAVSRHLISRGSPIAWCCQTRADNVDKDLLELMKLAGCRLVHVGVESGSEQVLASSGKATTKDDILSGVRAIEAAGMETLAFFMFGLPGETDKDREETIRFAIELEPTYASFHFATPYPGSELFEQSRVEVAKDLSFPLVPRGEDMQVLKSWVSRATRRFYLRPAYIVRHMRKGGLSHWGRQARLFLSYLR